MRFINVPNVPSRALLNALDIDLDSCRVSKANAPNSLDEALYHYLKRISLQLTPSAPLPVLSSSSTTFICMSE